MTCRYLETRLNRTAAAAARLFSASHTDLIALGKSSHWVSAIYYTRSEHLVITTDLTDKKGRWGACFFFLMGYMRWRLFNTLLRLSHHNEAAPSNSHFRLRYKIERGFLLSHSLRAGLLKDISD